MTARLSEPCRENALGLTGPEFEVERMSVLDGRTAKQLCLTCEQDIYIGVFFDGTNNNKYRDTAGWSHSNVARLYEAYQGGSARQTLPKLADRVLPDGSRQKREPAPEVPREGVADQVSLPQYRRKIYVPGVGTPHPDVGDDGAGVKRTLGLAMALMGQARLDWALSQLVNQVHAAVFKAPLETTLDLTQVSGVRLLRVLGVPEGVLHRFEDLEKWMQDNTGQYSEIGVAQYQDSLIQRLAKALDQRGRGSLPALRKVRLSVFGFSRGATEARAWTNLVLERFLDRKTGRPMVAGLPLQVDFLGLFDTVASVGAAHSVGKDGHYAWAEGQRLAVPEQVRRCVHLVSAHEVRGSFPLDSVAQSGVLPLNCKEIVYPGVHSDVGGGYPPEDQGRCLGPGAAGDSKKLSQVALAQMYREARMAGVPLMPAESMDDPLKVTFKIHPDLRRDFNAYVEATRTGRRAPLAGQGPAALASLFPTETQPHEPLHWLLGRHYAHQLQWRRQMLSTPGRVAELPGFQAMTADTRWQDAQDFREAEQELAKELSFLTSPDPKKFDTFDDATLDQALTRAPSTAVAAPALAYMALLPPAAMAGAAAWKTRDAVKKSAQRLMEEKQGDWRIWIRQAWNGEAGWRMTDDQRRATTPLFEKYVHDSRAWFKPLWTSDGMGMAPDDEAWFTLGGREAERSKRQKSSKEALVRAGSSGDAARIATAQKQLDELDRPGAPLIHGGREPYRMWGYLRERKVYMTGDLPAAKVNSINKAYSDADRETTRKDLLADEDAFHRKQMDMYRREQQKDWADTSRPAGQRQAQWEFWNSQGARELERHEENTARINKQYGAPAVSG